MGTCYKNNTMKSSKDKCYNTAMDCTRIALEEGLKIIAKHIPMRSLSLFQTENTIKCLTCGFGSPITIIEEKVKVLVHNQQTTADVDHTIYTYPLSLICNISNQYRIRNDTDRFSFGRSPFIIEPLDIVIITDGSSLRDGININNINKNPCIGNEFSESPFKWEHRIHLFVVTTGCIDESSISIPPDIIEFITQTGGEVIRSGQGIDKTIEEFSKLINVIVTSPFPAIKINVNNEAKYVKLKIKSITGEWPIPEFIGKELITIRPTYPVMRIDSSNNKDSDHTKFLDIAKQLDISIDSYEIVSSESSIVNVLDANRIRGVTMVDSSNNFTSLPFAMISREKNKLETLMIMPYNYTTLLPLVKATLDAKNKSDGNSWIQSWRTQIDDYIRRLPGYYYIPISRLMKRVGLPFPNIEYNLNRNFIKKMKYMQTVASREIILLEAAESKKWERLPLDAAQLAIGPTELQRGLLESPYAVTVSTSLSSSAKSYDLLASLEKMRKLIYGGPQSISCHGLSVDGIDGAGSYIQSGHIEADKNDWFGLATGANITRQLKMTDAGRYLNVLARKEANRDPMMAVDVSSQEEDSAKGILKRKFSVHFGNRYSQSKTKTKTSESSSSSSLSMSIEGIAFDKNSYEEFLVDSPAPHRGASSSDKVKPGRKMMPPSLFPTIKTESTIVVETAVSSPTSVSSSPASVSSSPASVSSSSPASVSVLPDGWVEGFSKKHSRIFWFHAGRNESVWKIPTNDS
jgi:hypothetical protein